MQWSLSKNIWNSLIFWIWNSLNLWGFIGPLNKYKLKLYYVVLSFALFICHGFNSLSTLESKSLVFATFRPLLISPISFCLYLMFLLNFFILCPKKILTVYLVHLNIMSCGGNFRSGFRAFCRFYDLRSYTFLGKLTVEQYFKSLEDKSNSLELPIFALSNNLQYGLEEVRVLTNLIF